MNEFVDFQLDLNLEIFCNFNIQILLCEFMIVTFII